MFFDNMFVRLIFAVLIIYLCYIDPTSAILLAVSFVVSVQTLNKHKINNMNNGEKEEYNSSSNYEEENTNVNNSSLNYENDNINESFFEEYTRDTPPTPPTLDTPDTPERYMDSLTNHYTPQKDIDDPLTKQNLKKEESKDVNNELDNLKEQNSFTNTQQLLSAQENTILDANQNDSVQTFKKQFSAQGSNYPSGYNLNGEGLNNAASF